MIEVFSNLLNMSMTASWLILAVIVLRIVMRKTPKNIICLLWGMVAIRLLCPISLESEFSFIPNMKTILVDVSSLAEVTENEKLDLGDDSNKKETQVEILIPSIMSGFINQLDIEDELLEDSFHTGNQSNFEDVHTNVSLENNMQTEAVKDSISVQDVLQVVSYIWILGIVVMVFYSIISYLRISRKVKEAVEVKKGIWFCDHIATPFLMGIFCPRIVIPSRVAKEDMKYIIAHENAHIKRKDNYWKPLGFVILILYWFNPLSWIAYILFSRDIEFACDECVMRTMQEEERKCYIKTVLNHSISKRTVAMYSLALGEIGVKTRIKTMLRYRKQTVVSIVSSVLLCGMVTTGFMINPKIEIPTSEIEKEEDESLSVNELEKEEEDFFSISEKEDNNDFEPIVVFNEEEYYIAVIGYSKKDSNNAEITLYCENKTSDKNFHFVLQDAAINGVRSFFAAGFDLKAGSKKQHVIRLNETFSDIYSVKEYTDVAFLVYDQQNEANQKVVHVYPQGEQNAIAYTREQKPTDKIIFENEYMTVTVVGHTSNTMKNDTAILFIENKSDGNIAWRREAFPRVNGKETIQYRKYGNLKDFYYSSDYTKVLLPKCCVYIEIQLPSELIQENNISNIQSWEVMFYFGYGRFTCNDRHGRVEETFTITP